ncbi:ATP-dependent DNA helicase [Paenibacillus allorhizosphaerae]|uniref:3'-5' exonuclease DinG n=1 Tax=Paenibacillus allorhizosphaerae TaxID=2849866 RepID=A0ABM8VV39_9BACL|nr:ATP-dependent DNA helicase [Paenibacillus allorhizosphaerae]CAG7659178.1 3'-5' exonuclease DinG [Paenibacillus allorhizosphaerae]
MLPIIRISVRALVEYAFRRGSLESGFHAAPTFSEGTLAHQKLQKTYGESDLKEVPLQQEFECGDLRFRLEGRCDGIRFPENELVAIEEIKSTLQDIKRIEEHAHPEHWAQAQCYAYMYAVKEGLLKLGVQLTYVQLDADEQIHFRKEQTTEELEGLVLGMLQVYTPYARLMAKHEQERNESARSLPFPYPAYREGQRKLAGAVYTAIAEGKDLFARAPTGTGKTISTLFPAVKAIGQGHLQRIFYITAKTITRTAAEHAMRAMADAGLRTKTVTLTAKEKVCFKDEVRCSKEYCEYADGFYDRLNGAMLDMLESEASMGREVIERYAHKHRVCPFELSIEAAYAADAVICDYNYVFDPRVSLKRLLQEQRKHTALLVDEAHNLVDRARDMFSAELVKSDFLHLQRESRGKQRELAQAAKALNEIFIELRKEVGERTHSLLDGPPQSLLERLESFAEAAEQTLVAGGEEEGLTLLKDVYFAAQSFLRIAKLADERFVTYAEVERSEVRVKLLCLDPSQLLRHMSNGYRAKIFFSATLSPFGFYKDVLGAGEDDYTFAIPSPFSKDQWEVSIAALSTRYRDRESSMARLGSLLRERISRRNGCYMVFFPSFDYLQAGVAAYEEEIPDADILVQTNTMSEEEREWFLDAFQAGRARTLVGFAVLGGIFSEGIDLQGDRLTGVIIVGVGLPQIGLERDLMKNYYNRTGRDGFDYAYVFPGMNKVLQAGGRLIRSERDRGSLVLVDDRYLQPKYIQLLPEEWRV